MFMPRPDRLGVSRDGGTAAYFKTHQHHKNCKKLVYNHKVTDPGDAVCIYDIIMYRFARPSGTPEGTLTREPSQSS